MAKAPEVPAHAASAQGSVVKEVSSISDGGVKAATPVAMLAASAVFVAAASATPKSRHRGAVSPRITEADRRVASDDLAKRAVDAMAAGRFVEAAEHYRLLAAKTGDPTYEIAERIARERARAR
jgi:hypothetical protein